MTMHFRPIYFTEDEPEDSLLDRAWELSEQGIDFLYNKQFDLAEASSIEAVSTMERVDGPYKADNYYLILDNLAAVYVYQEKWDQAEATLKKVLDFCKQTYGDNGDTGNVSAELARVYFRRQEYDRAEPLLLYALDMEERTWGRTNSTVSDRLTELIEFYGFTAKLEHVPILAKRRDRLDGFDSHWKPMQPFTFPKTPGVRRSAKVTDNYRIQLCWNLVEEAALSLPTDLSTARQCVDLAVKICSEELGAVDSETLLIYESLSAISFLQQDFAMCEVSLNHCITSREAAVHTCIDGEKVEELVCELECSLEQLGWLYRVQGRYEEASVCLRREMALVEGKRCSDPSDCLKRLASLYDVWQKPLEAQWCRDRATAISAHLEGEYRPVEEV